MTASSLLEGLFKYLFILSACIAGVVHVYKDAWPRPDYYDLSLLEAPLQTKTDREPFDIEAKQLRYGIAPKFDYDLYGVVVSYSNADGFTNIWHHKRWQDFINVRDLCVIWGKNVESGVYKDMKFNSDSWTCWAYWPDQETGRRFTMTELSNNHLVTDNDAVKAALMQAETGDLIHISGVLAAYTNRSTGGTRGTSTTRNDTGQGACETIYVDAFDIVKKANPGLRRLSKLFNWLTLLSFLGFVAMFLIAPPKSRYR
ncbi:MAG: hypothetical protein PHH11_00060 [Methylomonas sp.]|nr:hypothetical protein [Methylomonas sp.]